MDAKKQKQAEEKYMVLQMLDAQTKELDHQLKHLEEKNLEITRLNDSLENLSKIKKDTKGYSPLGLGLYAKSQILDTQEILVNVGSGIIVKKKLLDAKKILDNQLKQIEKVSLQLTQNLQNLSEKAQEVQEEIRQSQAELG